MWVIIKQFVGEALRVKHIVLLYILLSLALILVGLVQPYLYKLSIDSLTALAGDRLNTVLQSETLILIIYGFVLTYSMTIFQQLKDWLYWSKLGNPIFVNKVMRDYKRILSLDLPIFTNKKSGELMKIFDDGVEAYSNINHNFWEVVLIPVLSFFALLVFAWYQSPILTISCLIIIPIQIGWLYLSYRISKPYSKKAQKGWDKFFGNMGDTVSNILTVKSFHQEKSEFSRTEKIATDTLKISQHSLRIWELASLFDINTIATSAVILIGYYQVINGSATLGTVLMFTSILNRLMTPINLLKHSIQKLQSEFIKYTALEELLAPAPKVASPNNGHISLKSAGHITFKNVSFSYPNTENTVRNISLEIKPGEKVALVGHSGAGKSTLTLLIMRFYDVTKGSISLDGVDLRKWDYDNLRSHFGVVWQENMLFHTSILNNIRYSQPRATLTQVSTAAKQAAAEEFINRLSHKYKSIVGERGVRLSGGEKQRIAIARALLKDPSIVILDEATSALDSVTEKEVQKGILNLVKNRTAIIIAHRLSTVQHCDRIIVMGKGTIIAIGTHQELMKTCPQYQEMVTLQTQGFLAN